MKYNLEKMGRFKILVINIFIISNLILFSIYGQNLVPNPSFEQYSSCPVFASQLNLAVPWFNPTLGTPEFYHACAAFSSGVSVPYTFTGGYQPARTGGGFAGVYVFRFKDDAHTQHQIFNPEVWYTNCGYLLIDDVLLQESTLNLDIGKDTTLCIGEEIVLSAANTGTSWLWNTGSTHSDITVTNPGTFWVQATLGNCRISDTIVIQFLVAPSVNLQEDTVLCTGDQLVLDVTTWDAHYLWFDGTGNSVFTVTKPGTYSVYVYNRCEGQSDTIKVDYQDCYCKLLVPNIFTANGDGYNDVFLPVVDCRLSDYHLKIYNRWGVMVYETDNAGKAWDGTRHSQDSPEGTYFWTLTYTGNDNGRIITNTRNGVVCLLR